MSEPLRIERVEIVTDAGTVILSLRLHASGWWSVVTDTGHVHADTEVEAEARGALATVVAELEARGANVRRRFGAAPAAGGNS